MPRLTRRLLVENRRGLHARAAAKLVQTASGFSCEVQVARDGQEANAKSVMGVLLLCGSQGTELIVTTDGDDAEAALDRLEALFADKFGEGE